MAPVNKVAIFVEGSTETRFIKKLLGNRYGDRFVLNEVVLRGRDGYFQIQKREDIQGPDCYFLLVEVPSYEKVLSTILDNARSLIQQHGYQLLLGLRDLHPNKRSEKQRVMEAIHSIITKVPQHERIGFVLAVMETEAWFLCDSTLFEKINPVLTSSYILSKLSVDLANHDPELMINKPSKTIDAILRLGGQRYRKHVGEVELLVRNINLEILASYKGAKIDSYFRFVNKLDRACIGKAGACEETRPD